MTERNLIADAMRISTLEAKLRDAVQLIREAVNIVEAIGAALDAGDVAEARALVALALGEEDTDG